VGRAETLRESVSAVLPRGRRTLLLAALRQAARQLFDPVPLPPRAV
jgi:hypothetical protein